MAKTTQVTTLDDETSTDVVQADPAVVVPKTSGIDEQLSGEKRTVTVHQTGDENEQAVFVSLNGYAYQIPRGVPCSVPVEVIEILQNAKQTTYTQTPTGVVERTVQRFPFSVQ